MQTMMLTTGLIGLKALNGSQSVVNVAPCVLICVLSAQLYMLKHGFPVITSSLGISRWKNMNQINDCGLRAAANYEGIDYWTYNWRKQGGSERMYQISKQENFYKQEYCGCVYSLRDTNLWRKKTNRKTIHFGQEFYN